MLSGIAVHSGRAHEMPRTAVRRRAAIALSPNGAHRLEIDLRGFDFGFDRDGAGMMAAALERTGDELALWMLSPLVPALREAADVVFLRAALRAYLEEVAAEDRRPDLRTHRVRKPLVV